MAMGPGVNGRRLRIGMFALMWAVGTGVVVPPPAMAGTCGGLPATIDLEDQPGPVYIEGTSDDDVIHGSLGNDTIFGKGGKDTICGDTGADNIDGGSGNDTIYGMGVAGSGDNAGNTLIGGTGRDFLEGDRFGDTLRGGPGQDQLYGGSNGTDTIYGNDDPPSPTAHDTIDGGQESCIVLNCTPPPDDHCFPNGADTKVNCS
jgi:Ca2+-binding RTX toxin-like protein